MISQWCRALLQTHISIRVCDRHYLELLKYIFFSLLLVFHRKSTYQDITLVSTSIIYSRMLKVLMKEAIVSILISAVSLSYYFYNIISTMLWSHYYRNINSVKAKNRRPRQLSVGNPQNVTLRLQVLKHSARKC